MTNLVVGQKLLFVRAGHGIDQARELTVQAIARKWAYCDGFRVDKRTLAVADGDRRPLGRCYLSREHYEAEAAAAGAG